ncbi:translocation/assembly module TamB domain-containing protein [Sulfitobacter sp.]|uniref:translocation/assembly module TamB domain-containing protein n=1 Tax=Sulfitobacter sp. TaxID=1903071 RepID=UPI0032993830
MRMLPFALSLMLLTVVTPARAQDQTEEDKGFIVSKIQELLSGAGRTVDISGFRGVLSSEASFDRMTISDADGVWLTMEDVVLDWNRSALLRGRLDVEELSAARIDMPRLPKGEEETLPDAEAEPFTMPTLPDLPVSVNIAALRIDEVSLGAPLVGQDAQFEMNANAVLNDDGLDMAFTANRTDGKRGAFDLMAKLSRGDDQLDMELTLSEDEGGLVSTLLNIPDEPSVDMNVTANGPLGDLVTVVKLDTDGAERLGGEVRLSTQGDDSDPDRRIVADIGGDITAVVLPQYRDFFGDHVELKMDALMGADGAVTLSALDLQAAAVDLQGELSLSDEKWPTYIDITGNISRADKQPVLLPGGGGDTTVGRVVLNVTYDTAQSDAYEAIFNISDIATSAGTVDQTVLRSTGTITGVQSSIGELQSDVTFAARGLSLLDAALAEAVGSEINATTKIDYTEDEPLRVSDLDLQGSDYSLTGDVVFNGIGEGLETTLDALLTASDLGRFSALAGRELDGATSLELKGSVTPLSGEFDLEATGTADDIKTGISQADALLAGRTNLTMNAVRDETGTFLRDLDLSNAAMSFTGEASLSSADSSVDADVELFDIATILPQYEGPVSLTGTASKRGEAGWQVDVDADGPYEVKLTLDGIATGEDADLQFDANVPDLSKFSEGVEGALVATGNLRQTPEGYLLQTNATGPYNATADINGLVTPSVNVGFDLSVPELSAISPQVSGPLNATGRLRQTSTGFEIDTDASGPYAADLSVDGTITPKVAINFDLALPDVQQVVPQVNGTLRATGQLRQTDSGFEIDSKATGPYGANVAVAGALTPAVDVTFNAALPNVASLAPGVNGPFTARGSLRQTDAGFAVDTSFNGPYSSSGSANGVVTGDNPAIRFSAGLPNIASLVPDLRGALNVSGTANQTAQGWQLDTAIQGPAGTQATVAGLVGGDGSLDMDINGSAPLGLSAPFIEPRSLQGDARFDLALNGPAGLGALSGTIQTSGATLSAPNLRVNLEDINAVINLANSRANIDITGNSTGGGDLAVSGDVGLTGAYPANIAINLDDIVIEDPRLYRTSIDGDLQLAGPLTGGAAIRGDLTVGETTVTVPSTGLTSIGDIPVIAHVGAGAEDQATRRRAGLVEESETSGADGSETSGVGFALDVNVNAPGRIFIRGRGLDAELGGNLRLAGSTVNIISTGRFELVRGRLDILGKRFDLEEGYAQFQGDFTPYIRFVTTTDTETGTASIIVEGFSDSPEVSFESDPDGPQDEVLAQILFGRSISEISPFQALQLANAVATLAGKGGSGVVGNLRDEFGLDDLDVTTTDSGETALRVGKYLSDNIYTDVTAASDGTADVSINIDLTKNIIGKATLGSDGTTSLGVFFEKDY